MVQLIVGEKGKGKTKHLLDKVNSEVKTINGNIVYLDKKYFCYILYFRTSQYLIENNAEFLGFVSGIISQDHDLQQMYFDSFLKIAKLEDQDITADIAKLEKMSEIFKVDFILSVSMNESDLPEELKSKILISL